MDRAKYIHKNQDEAFSQYKHGISFQKDIEKIYEENSYKLRQPDLLGKTVKITNKQFPEIYRLMSEMAKNDNMECPPVYVYEDYYYGAESYGISKPWIEISAKTIQDFSENELKFVLAREFYKIKDGVTKQRTMMETYFNGMRLVAPNEFEEISKFAFYSWYRLTNFTADNYGYLTCGSIKNSINAVLKMVLNSGVLASQTDVKEFIGQASEINMLDDDTSNYTKADESVPYAPHRIQNLLAFAVSERSM